MRKCHLRAPEQRCARATLLPSMQTHVDAQGFLEVWGEGATLDELEAAMRVGMPPSTSDYFAADKTWKARGVPAARTGGQTAPAASGTA